MILGFVSQPENPHDERTGAIALWRRIRERIAALPDVASVATASGTPAGGMNFGLPLIREGEDVEKAATSGANVVIASGAYFQTVGIPLIAGRISTQHDARCSHRQPSRSRTATSTATPWETSPAAAIRIQPEFRRGDTARNRRRGVRRQANSSS